MSEFLKDPIFEVTKEKLKQLGIEAVLFDLDDTLIYTGEMFNKYMLEYAEVVSEKIGMEVAEFMKALHKVNNETYKKLGVNPKKWEVVVESLSLELGKGRAEILENIDILMQIYTTVPRLRTGVRSLLEIFKASGVKVGLVTHANVEWTEFKLEELNLWDYFESVTIVDENGHKKSEDWKRGMDSLGVEPEKCLVVGDSLNGDIQPADSLGTRTVWLPSSWSMYRTGEVPERTVVIEEIFGLLSALDDLR